MPPLRRLLICPLIPALCASLFAQAPNFTETKKRAEAGNAKAQNDLGEMYNFGKGVPRDDVEAVKWLRKAAEQGHANAQNHLGGMCEYGMGVPQDKAEAAKWYRKAAEQGHADAQNHLGWIYQDIGNLTGMQNEAEAAKWYRKAAEQGHADAQDSLGSMYKSGSGVPKDEVEAYAWYNLAAFRRIPQPSNIYQDSKTLIEFERQRYEFAMKCRDKLNLTPEEKLRAQKRSTELFNEIEARKKAAGK
jgi:TPR repeat protein